MALNENKPSDRVHKDGTLYVNPSKASDCSPIFLSESKLSWITVTWLSDDLQSYANECYQSLFQMHPATRGKVVTYDDIELVSPRWHRSYLHQPDREVGAKGSYMYSGIEKFEDLSLPSPFQKFLDFLNEQEPTHPYNQVIVNWYGDGNDYTAPHSDCQKGMVSNSGITIVSLCEDANAPRELRITPKKLKDEPNDSLYRHIKIALKHGSVITMHGETQKYFRHGVPKESMNPSSRISLTFRKFIIDIQ